MRAIFDYAEAVEKAGGNSDLAKELFGMLLQELPTLHDKLRVAIDKADTTAIWDHAHKLYGATAYCGVPLLRKVAGEMEVIVRTGDMVAIERHYSVLDETIAKLLEQGPEQLSNW